MNERRGEALFARIVGYAILFSLSFAQLVSADSFQTVLSFSAPIAVAGPGAGLTTDGAVLYGTARSPDGGSVFSVNKDGSNFQMLHTFGHFMDNRAIDPERGLTLSGNKLFGTTTAGGSGLAGSGTVFSVDTDGSNFQTLHAFGDDMPDSNLTLLGGTLYGTSPFGLGGKSGLIYSVNADGSGYQELHQFGNTGGTNPSSALLPVGGSLYGTTHDRVGFDGGTLYKIDPSGANFQLLFSFPGGINPIGDLIVSGNTLYGVTNENGIPKGTVFSIGTDGSNFHLLHTFNGADGRIPSGANEQFAGLTLVGDTLYGTTALQDNGFGEVFSVKTDGTNFQIVHSFTNSPGEGQTPWGDLLLSGNTLYGTTEHGGANGAGTIFAINVPEPSSVVLAGFGLIALATGAWRRARPPCAR